MRQLIVQVPHGQGEDVLRAARRRNALHLARFEAAGGDEADGRPLEVVLLNIPNAEVGEFITPC